MAQPDDDSITVPSPQKQRPSVRKTHPQGDWNRDPRADSRGAMAVPFPVQIARLSTGLVADYLAELAESEIGGGSQRFIRAILKHVDYPTRVCSRRRGYLLREARVVERWATMLVTQCGRAGLLTRLRYDAKHPDLRPPKPNELRGTEEWELGAWFLRVEPTSLTEWREGLKRLKKQLRERRSRVQGVDPGIDPPGRSRDRSPSVQGVDPGIDPPDGSTDRSLLRPAGEALNDLDPSLYPDRLNPTSADLGSQGDLQDDSLPSGKLSQGDLGGSAGTETGPQTPLAESESKEGSDPNESGMRTAGGPEAPPPETPEPLAPAPVVDSEPTSAEDGASAGRATGRAYPKISALVGDCQRASERGGLARFEAAALFGWFVEQHKRGCDLEWMHAFAVGVARGQGEARAGRLNAKAAGVNPFHYATGDAELYVHEGRRIADVDRYAGAVRDRPDEAAPRSPKPPQKVPDADYAAQGRNALQAFLATIGEGERKP